jgi:hypothetical protein
MSEQKRLKQRVTEAGQAAGPQPQDSIMSGPGPGGPGAPGNLNPGADPTDQAPKLQPGASPADVLRGDAPAMRQIALEQRLVLDREAGKPAHIGGAKGTPAPPPPPPPAATRHRAGSGRFKPAPKGR